MLTAARLRELVIYDPESGRFTWRVSRVACRAGDECGRISRHGYREICVDYKLHRACRLAVLYMTGSWPAECVDHINRVRSDDRWANLRECTKKQNGGNVPARNGIKGVSWDKTRGKWLVQARLGGVRKNLGRYDDPEEAAAVFRAAMEREHGEFFSAA
jgi:hypothetical protein